MSEPGEYTTKARSSLNKLAEMLMANGKHVPLPIFKGGRSSDTLLDWINSVKATLSTLSEGYRAYCEGVELDDDAFIGYIPTSFLDEEGNPGPEALELIHETRARVMLQIRLRTHSLIYGQCLVGEPRSICDCREFRDHEKGLHGIVELLKLLRPIS